ncbi:hypothetical protein B0J14DRAFT_634707 [Halenospora varia]|nr:hypothetical protein B0J14DRAFT_634707 [Halenospora varia]
MSCALSSDYQPRDILNDRYAVCCPAQEALRLLEFTGFSRFLTEISSAIWTSVLQCHRLIGIAILNNYHDQSSPLPRPEDPYTTTNQLGNIISGENYRLSITTLHRLSPLLRVNRQSRQVTSEFYRVHVPYDLPAQGDLPCLYLNPEFDIFHFQH